MTIWCKHVYRLELHLKKKIMLRIYSLARYKDEIPVFPIFDMVVQNKKSEIAQHEN